MDTAGARAEMFEPLRTVWSGIAKVAARKMP